MDFAVLRALTSYHCGPGSIASVNAMCGLSFHWFLRYLLPTESFPWVLSAKLPLQTSEKNNNTFQQVLKNS